MCELARLTLSEWNDEIEELVASSEARRLDARMMEEPEAVVAGGDDVMEEPDSLVAVAEAIGGLITP